MSLYLIIFFPSGLRKAFLCWLTSSCLLLKSVIYAGFPVLLIIPKYFGNIWDAHQPHTRSDTSSDQTTSAEQTIPYHLKDPYLCRNYHPGQQHRYGSVLFFQVIFNNVFYFFGFLADILNILANLLLFFQDPGMFFQFFFDKHQEESHEKQSTGNPDGSFM